MAATAPKMRAPPGPLVGRLRLYLIGANPPAGGMSLWASKAGEAGTDARGGETVSSLARSKQRAGQGSEQGDIYALGQWWDRHLAACVSGARGTAAERVAWVRVAVQSAVTLDHCPQPHTGLAHATE